ncbi:hypothetical protein A4249_06905 [Brevundimonas sp. GW460-12-10-14-LB2]|nr:hypothetical protein A4249_06905 [Brevundimonas sp. GW460-12-10-14-LB2]
MVSLQIVGLRASGVRDSVRLSLTARSSGELGPAVPQMPRPIFARFPRGVRAFADGPCLKF